MADDKKSQDMNEYKFAESEGLSPTSMDEQPSLGEDSGSSSGQVGFSVKNINRKRVGVIATIIVCIILLYMFFSMNSSRKTRTPAEQQLTSQSVTPTTNAPARAVSSVTDEQITQLQNTLQQKLDDAAKQATSDREQISNLNDVVSKAQQDIATMSQSMNQLALTMQQALIEIHKLKAPKAKPKKKAVVKVPIAYHIRAIVPGRAWLESSDGKNATVRIGDKIPGYGTVEIISPKQGMIMMSNGTVIQYGVNDF